MSNFIDKIKALITEEEPAPPAPAETAPPEEPPVQTTPPAEPPQPEPPNIEALLAKQKEELEASFTEKLKGIQSSSTPPPPVPPEPKPTSGDMDFSRWNKEIENINKKNNTHQN